MSSHLQTRRIESEHYIFDVFRMTDKSGILFASDKEVKDLIKCPDFIPFAAAYHGDKKLWKDTSGKADMTPDFFSEEYESMIEFMRVDDHACVNEKGKVVNPAASEDSKKFNELVKSGLLEDYPNAGIIVTSDTRLPTLEDHNYQWYKSNFKRVVEEHISKIPTYRKNHPECKHLAFLIFDESCGYFEVESIPEEFKEGTPCLGKPHFWFMDDTFTKVFTKSEVDCVIWFTPYKFAESRFVPGGLPVVSVFFKSEGEWKTITYDESHMMPAEV